MNMKETYERAKLEKTVFTGGDIITDSIITGIEDALTIGSTQSADPILSGKRSSF